MDQDGFHHGIELFNRGEFYEAHEVLEDIWRAATGPEKLLIQGLVQIAVALHHHSTGNLVGARSVLARGERNLSGYPEHYAGIDLNSFRHSLAAWREALDLGDPPPRLPIIVELRRSHRGQY